jgi:glycosyltransferase involved in cell wall biosynthesis
MISIIVSWRDRIELKKALPALVGTSNKVAGEIILVNFSGSIDLLRDQLEGYEQFVRVINVERQPIFNKCAALNVGAAASKRQMFFFCDCDVILDPMQIKGLVSRVAADGNSFATLENVRESEAAEKAPGNIILSGYSLSLRVRSGRKLKITHEGLNYETGSRMAPGLLIVKRADFLKIDGYNSEFIGWGWESQDIIGRLILGGGLERITEGTALHLSHSDHSRVHHCMAKDRWENRDRIFRQAIQNYNEGNFSGTYTADIRKYLTTPFK